MYLAVCDDNREELDAVLSLLGAWRAERGGGLRVRAFRSAVELAAAAQQNHGQGCRSIQTITQAHQGLCDFSAEGGIFTLRVALPM